MRLRDLLRILLINSLYSNVINLVFLADWAQAIWKELPYAIGMGLIVYGIQTVLLYRLCKPFQANLPFKAALSMKPLLVGLSVGLLVWVVAQLAAILLHKAPIVNPDEQKLQRFLIVFVLNTCIGAFLEELVFRFLPIEFGKQSGFGKLQLILLYLGITALFALTHLAAYSFRDRIGADQLIGALWQPFLFGIGMILVYLGIRNIYFIALFHALGNNSIFWVETPYFSLTFWIVSLIWFGYRFWLKRYRFE